MNARRRKLFALGSAVVLAQRLTAVPALLLTPFTVLGQSKEPLRQVGVLTGSNESFFAPTRAAFESALTKYGWQSGKNVSILYRHTSGDRQAAYQALSSLLAARVDVLVVAGAMLDHELRAQVKSTPVVMIFGGDPVAKGLAMAMSRPGGNFTGVAFFESPAGDTPKLLETLRDAFPKLRRLGVLCQGDDVGDRREIHNLAKSLGIELVYGCIANHNGIDRALRELVLNKVEAVWVILHPTWSIKEVVLKINNARLASISDVGEFAKAGGLIAFAGADTAEVFQQFARMVDRILRGTNAGELPIESPPPPKLVINASTARALGYQFPSTLLLRADRVIE